MKLFGFASTIVLHALVALSLVQLANAEVSCIDFTKGEFGPETITSDPICEMACQKAEGLPVGRFKGEGDSYKECKCLKIEQDGSASETRDLCQDGAPSGAGRVASRMGLTLATTTILAALVASM